MHTPTIIFDLIKKTVTITGTSPEADREVADFVVASQQQHAGNSPKA